MVYLHKALTPTRILFILVCHTNLSASHKDIPAQLETLFSNSPTINRLKDNIQSLEHKLHNYDSPNKTPQEVVEQLAHEQALTTLQITLAQNQLNKAAHCDLTTTKQLILDPSEQLSTLQTKQYNQKTELSTIICAAAIKAAQEEHKQYVMDDLLQHYQQCNAKLIEEYPEITPSYCLLL